MIKTLSNNVKELLLGFADFRPFDSLGLAGVGAEVGVCKGIHARMMLKKNPGITRLYLIDSYTSYAEIYSHNFNRHFARMLLYPWRQKIEWVRASSACMGYADTIAPLDFCYIDADHSYQGALADIENVWPRIKSGGVMGGHDFWDIPDVDRAVQDFCRDRQLTYTAKKTDWWIKKP